MRAEEVLLNVTVTDEYGHQETGLKKQDFIISEDGKRQDITSFLVSTVPVNVLLLLDASGSVAGQIDSLRSAAEQFVKHLSPEDKVSAIEFHTNIELIQDWTSSQNDLMHAISWRFRPGVVRDKRGNATLGSTSLYDAVYLAATEQLAKVDGRKAIIMLTDGVDTSSKVTFEQALASVIKTGAVVYVVSKARAFIQALKGYTNPVSRVFGGGMAQAAGAAIAALEGAEQLMTDLCKKTGGRIFSPIEDKELSGAYGEVAQELKSQYIITYVPKNEARDGQLRYIKVYLARAGYSARTRESYYAPKD
ncbi:MAG TPA: VWA domain-containing protein [Blastocatellia bacterium]|nr:VWA domain-containing protein [Blastocatellia bacterium]